jgi:Tol biopolymer transport system component
VSDAARWNEVKGLFQAALDREPHERAAFLRETCGDDRALQADVESLLAADAQAGNFAQRPAIASLDPSAAGAVAHALAVGDRVLGAGDRLGPHEILGAVGAGGMGEVYKARDTRLERSVAIKVLPSPLATDPQFRERFDREAKAIAGLTHPHICTLYDVGHQDGTDYLVMEYVDGQTLAARLNHGALPLHDALLYASEIADALEAAHEKGIIHRDLKPANIKITPAGVVKVLDFGLAKIVAPAGSTADVSRSPTAPVGGTREGIILGTAAYMSPEQARGQAVDKRTDIWAFGCVFYEMLTGRAVFAGATMTDTLAAILEREPDWRALPNATPAGVGDLLRRCLKKDPKRRLRDIGDARIEIDDASSIDAGRSDVARRKHLTWKWAAVAALLVTFAVVAAWRAGRPFENGIAPAHPNRSSLLLPTDVTFGIIAPALRLALSPDGTRVAFSAFGPDGRVRLYVRSLDALTAQPLAETEGAFAPFWSPDSRFIGYFSGGTNGALKKIPANGGPPVTLCDFPATATGASWSRDDVILFTTGNGRGGGPIRRVSASGGSSSVVLSPDPAKGEMEYWWPFFLPDGKHFVYLALGQEVQPIGIYAASLGSSERKLLVRGGSNAKYANGYLTFLREQTLMAQAFDVERLDLVGDPMPIAEDVTIGGGSGATGAYTISDTGMLAYHTGIGDRSRLMWFDRTGQLLGSVGDEAHYGDLQLSPDGKRASVSLPDPTAGTRDIWLVDLTRGLRTRFTFDVADERDSVWSPDGTRLVFNSRRKQAFDLYEKASSGVGAEDLLFADDVDKIPVSWSADGRFILYMRNGGGDTSWDLWVLPLSGEKKPFPFAQTRFAEGPGAFSPDGRWIAYVSNESGQFEIYVAPFPGPGGKVQVSSGITGGYPFLLMPRWRRDGTEIFYRVTSGLMTASVHVTGDALEITAVHPLLQFRGPVVPLRLRAFYDVSGDGQRFLINGIEGSQGSPAPITLVTNWTAALKK